MTNRIKWYRRIPLVRKYIQAYENERLMANPEYISFFYRGKYKAVLLRVDAPVAVEVEAIKLCLEKLGWKAMLKRI